MTKTLTDDEEALASALRLDRMIKVFVGQETQPFLVPQSSLCAASKIFVKTIKNEHLGKDVYGVLRCPEDDLESFTMLLFWIMRACLPDPQMLPLSCWSLDRLVRAWILGDKYAIPEFQDLIMLELLDVLSSFAMEPEIAQEIFMNTHPDSPLRRLAAEELVFQLNTSRPKIHHSDLSILDGATGAAQCMAAAMLSIMHTAESTQDWTALRKLPDRLNSQTASWKRYLVSDGPTKHWIFAATDDKRSNHREECDLAL